jgi:uncharacterized protein (TIGR00251 family)
MSFEIDIKVIPRSSQEKIEPQPNGTLKLWVRAAPTDGQANEAVCKLLSKMLKVPKTAVVIIKGETAREKRVRIDSIEPSEARKRLF